MKQRKIAALLALVLACMMTLTACGGGVESGINGGYYDGASVSGSYGMSAINKSDGTYDVGMGEVSDDYEIDPGMELPDHEEPSDIQAGYSQKLIRDFSVTVETDDFDGYIAWLDGAVPQFSGYIESSDVRTYLGDSDRYMTVTIRIPSDQVDGFMSSLDENGNVTRKTENTTDVTLQYSELEARIESLETQQDRLLELLAQAQDLQSMLDIEDRLADVWYELENYGTQMKILSNRVAYSTVQMSVSEVIDYTAPSPETFLERVVSGFKDDLSGVGVFLEDLAVWVLSHIPSLCLLAVVVVFIIFGHKVYRKKHPRKPKKEKRNRGAAPMYAAPVYTPREVAGEAGVEAKTGPEEPKNE